MASKKKRKKKLYSKWLDKNATKILCRYCDLRDECSIRESKEKLEQEGMITRCIFTPNKKIKKTWEKYNKAGEIINVNRNGIPIDKSFSYNNSNNKKDNKKRFYKNYRKRD